MSRKDVNLLNYYNDWCRYFDARSFKVDGKYYYLLEDDIPPSGALPFVSFTEVGEFGNYLYQYKAKIARLPYDIILLYRSDDSCSKWTSMWEFGNPQWGSWYFEPARMEDDVILNGDTSHLRECSGKFNKCRYNYRSKIGKSHKAYSNHKKKHLYHRW